MDQQIKQHSSRHEGIGLRAATESTNSISPTPTPWSSGSEDTSQRSNRSCGAKKMKQECFISHPNWDPKLNPKAPQFVWKENEPQQHGCSDNHQDLWFQKFA